MLSERQALVKIDIDKGMHRPTLYELQRTLARAGYSIAWMMEKCSKSLKGFHIVLSVNPRPRTAMEVVALQAILGSDPNREACNVLRARQWAHLPKFWRDRWNVLYY